MPAVQDVNSATQGTLLTKSDSTVIPVTRALWVGGVGDVAVTFADGGVVTLSAVPAGTLLPVRVTKLMSTNTTATLVVALY
jgi:hypothetical protein